uniref:enoyl-CoA hydratase/isomerase family protein n=1 Tax=Gillisia sp. CAL575 TaxID=985255 RepID=UPI000554A7AB
TEAAAIKLSELTIGIGPFVIAPAVERKIGLAALSELSLAAYEWKNAYWAQEKGLYAKVFESISDLDKEIQLLSEKIASFNPQATQEMKRVLWENTSHWDKLLISRAAVSGELVLSEFTKNALSKFKK